MNLKIFHFLSILLLLTSCAGKNGPLPGDDPKQNLPFHSKLTSPEGDYYLKVRAKIFKNWLPPPELIKKLEQNTSLELLLTIKRDGSLANIDLSKSSHIEELDKSALKAIIDSAPFTPPPLTTLSRHQLATLSWNFSVEKKEDRQ